MLEEALPGAEAGERERGASTCATPRLRCEAPSRDGRVLGGDAVAVERGQREDLVALADVTHVGRDRRDDPGELVRRDRGSRSTGHAARG